MIPDLYGQITSQDLPKAEPGLLRVLNRLQSSIQTFAQGRVSLSENVKCDVVNGVFSHGVPTQVKLTKVSTPGSAVVLGADGHYPLSASVVAGGSGGSNVTLLFANPTAKNVQATVAIYSEGTKARSTPDPYPVARASAASGFSGTSLGVLAGSNTWTDLPGMSTASYVPISSTRPLLVTWTFSGFATGASGGNQTRVIIGGVTSGASSIFWNTMAQHQSWSFQFYAGNQVGNAAGTPITVKAQLMSQAGSGAAFNQDANDSGSIIVQELG